MAQAFSRRNSRTEEIRSQASPRATCSGQSVTVAVYGVRMFSLLSMTIPVRSTHSSIICHVYCVIFVFESVDKL